MTKQADNHDNVDIQNVSSSAEKLRQCPEFPYFGATYPDARCIDGALHDMDRCDDNGNLYEMFEYCPCPFCNKAEFVKEMKENDADMEKVEEWIKETLKKYG